MCEPQDEAEAGPPNDGLVEDGDSYDDPHDVPLYLGGEGADGNAGADDDDSRYACPMA